MRVPLIGGRRLSGRKPRIVVLFGGRSTEHSISCLSAGSVLRALDRTLYDVVPVGISQAGSWVLVPDDADRLAAHSGVLPNVAPATSTVALGPDPAGRALIAHDPGQPGRSIGEIDVVFPLLHGPFGEDGTVQGLLELVGVPYVGSGVLASALAMDKPVSKVVLAAAGLPIGPFVVIHDETWRRGPGATLALAREALTLPVFVKPARAGSSMGISKVMTWDELESAVELAREHDPKVLIEQAVAGRELECGVLEGIDGSEPEASVCAEVTVGGDHAFYDFEAKYLDGATTFDVPAHLPPETMERVQQLAIRAFVALGCEGLARVDFFLTPEGDVIVNEVNTMPGFTPASMFPRMWAESGLGYPQLIDRLINSALTKGSGLR